MPKAEVKLDGNAARLIAHLNVIKASIKEEGNEAIGASQNYDVLVHNLNVLALRLSNGDEDLISGSIIEGRFLREEINEFAETLIERAIDFSRLVFQKPYPSESIQKLGIVWDLYDVSFSSNNLEACIKILSREKDLIKDALDELLENDEGDTETEELARSKGSGLVKTTLKLSEYVDDYVFSLYSASEEPDSVRESAETLNESANNILDKIHQNPERSKLFTIEKDFETKLAALEKEVLSESDLKVTNPSPPKSPSATNILKKQQIPLILRKPSGQTGKLAQLLPKVNSPSIKIYPAPVFQEKTTTHGSRPIKLIPVNLEKDGVKYLIPENRNTPEPIKLLVPHNPNSKNKTPVSSSLPVVTPPIKVVVSNGGVQANVPKPIKIIVKGTNSMRVFDPKLTKAITAVASGLPATSLSSSTGRCSISTTGNLKAIKYPIDPSISTLTTIPTTKIINTNQHKSTLDSTKLVKIDNRFIQLPYTNSKSAPAFISPTSNQKSKVIKVIKGPSVDRNNSLTTKELWSIHNQILPSKTSEPIHDDFLEEVNSLKLNLKDVIASASHNRMDMLKKLHFIQRFIFDSILSKNKITSLEPKVYLDLFKEHYFVMKKLLTVRKLIRKYEGFSIPYPYHIKATESSKNAEYEKELCKEMRIFGIDDIPSLFHLNDANHDFLTVMLNAMESKNSNQFCCRTCFSKFGIFSKYIRHLILKHPVLLRCKYCGDVFISALELKEHIKSAQHGYCGRCDIFFNNYIEYFDHIKVLHDDSKSSVQTVNTVVKKDDVDKHKHDIYLHMCKYHPNNNCFVCSTSACKLSFDSVNKLYEHFIENHVAIWCRFCSEDPVSKVDQESKKVVYSIKKSDFIKKIMNPLKQNSPDKTKRCLTCRIACASAAELESHADEFHKEIHCGKCDFVAKGKKMYQEHFDANHFSREDGCQANDTCSPYSGRILYLYNLYYICPICVTAFLSTEERNEHARVKHSDKICHLCDNSDVVQLFIFKSLLHNHFGEVHKDRVCMYCQAKTIFESPELLNVHVNIFHNKHVKKIKSKDKMEAHLCSERSCQNNPTKGTMFISQINHDVLRHNKFLDIDESQNDEPFIPSHCGFCPEGLKYYTFTKLFTHVKERHSSIVACYNCLDIPIFKVKENLFLHSKLFNHYGCFCCSRGNWNSKLSWMEIQFHMKKIHKFYFCWNCEKLCQSLDGHRSICSMCDTVHCLPLSNSDHNCSEEDLELKKKLFNNNGFLKSRKKSIDRYFSESSNKMPKTKLKLLLQHIFQDQFESIFWFDPNLDTSDQVTLEEAIEVLHEATNSPVPNEYLIKLWRDFSSMCNSKFFDPMVKVKEEVDTDTVFATVLEEAVKSTSMMETDVFIKEEIQDETIDLKSNDEHFQRIEVDASSTCLQGSESTLDNVLVEEPSQIHSPENDMSSFFVDELDVIEPSIPLCLEDILKEEECDDYIRSKPGPKCSKKKEEERKEDELSSLNDSRNDDSALLEDIDDILETTHKPATPIKSTEIKKDAKFITFSCNTPEEENQLCQNGKTTTGEAKYTPDAIPEAEHLTLPHQKCTFPKELNDAHLDLLPIKDAKLGDIKSLLNHVYLPDTSKAILSATPYSDLNAKVLDKHKIATQDKIERLFLVIEAPHIHPIDEIVSLARDYLSNVPMSVRL
ncbi:unnamed protein product [Lepeophtheirus salmonis]|uniref:(salmon louse) hypothetical protein n=1 Tax=Lepeophtheirus salmonis TaxID=72036 RepID=A0A7R8CXD8_LEPSM|nr:unnamed protein product [Lepeophtheirus salmonis]CAF2914335.1 unnamed protein product [Lepeophtheirus salmonis]